MTKCFNKNCELFSLGCDRLITTTCEVCGECMNIPYTKYIIIPREDIENIGEDDGMICPSCSCINYYDINTKEESNNDVRYLERTFNEEWLKNGILE